MPTDANLTFKLWERTSELPLTERALAFLSGEAEPCALAALPVGERDARLFRLHAAQFGSRLQATVDCPACQSTAELELTLDTLIALAPPRARGSLQLSVDGVELTFKLPDSRDMIAASAARDVPEARALLLDRCLLRATCGDTELTASQLPDALVQAIARAMDEADPQANVELAICCPDCKHPWTALLDITVFLSAQLETTVRALLDEVADLARAFGWSERDILALSPRRRAAYLERVRA